MTLLLWTAGMLVLTPISLRLCLNIARRGMPWARAIAALALLLYITAALSATRAWLIEPFSIPSGSMEDTIRQGDIVLVDKPAGARERLRSGDIYVYRLSPGSFAIKRCAALAGDQLIIDGDKVIVKGKKAPMPPQAKSVYRISPPSRNGFFLYLDSIKLSAGLSRDPNQPGTLVANLNERQRAEVAKFDPAVTILAAERFHGQLPPDALFGRGITVPKAGLSIVLDAGTSRYYKMAIQKGEGVKLEEKNGTYYLNGSPASRYTFTSDYLFMIGDNRGSSMDSRATGFVKASEVIGRAFLAFTTPAAPESPAWPQLIKKL